MIESLLKIVFLFGSRIGKLMSFVLFFFVFFLLCQELEKAEFIPMEDKNDSSPWPLNQPVINQLPHDFQHLVLPTHNPSEAQPSAVLSSSNGQTSLNASSISVGFAASQVAHSLPQSVPPLCLDGLSGSGDSIRLQMIRDRERDEELEALNQRVIHLEAENKTVRRCTKFNVQLT